MSGVKTRSVFRSQREMEGFTRLEDPLEMNRYLNRAIEISAKADIRLPGSELRFTSSISERSDLKNGLRIEVPELLDLDKQKALAGGVMVVAFLRGQVLLCIQSDRVEWKDGEIRVMPPWAVFKLQRRKEPRFEIPAAYELMASMEAADGTRRRVRRMILDISCSGMGFQVTTQREAEFFKRGLFLRQLEIFIENRQIFLDAKVCNSIPIRDNPKRQGYKVGIEFIRIGPVDARFIASYVARSLAQMYF